LYDAPRRDDDDTSYAPAAQMAVFARDLHERAPIPLRGV